jgi:hypothetical protein|tara:strand:- start:99 stop:716 length:618 start_codon:yes stop_codon:yes gene_type:complete
MAVNKNFVVKNGIEVATDLLFVTSDQNKVGIGSTLPSSKFDVAGGIAAVDAIFTGITTAVSLTVGTGGTIVTTTGVGSIGISTTLPEYLIDIRSPVSTGQTALYVQGDMRVTGDIAVDDITFDHAELTSLTVSGMSTLGVTTTTYLDSQRFTSSGISTIGNFLITPLGIGATVGNNAGIVTYYGDGSQLQNTPGVSIGMVIALGS